MPTLKSNAIPEYVLHTPAHIVYIYHMYRGMYLYNAYIYTYFLF